MTAVRIVQRIRPIPFARRRRVDVCFDGIGSEIDERVRCAIHTSIPPGDVRPGMLNTYSRPWLSRSAGRSRAVWRCRRSQNSPPRPERRPAAHGYPLALVHPIWETGCGILLSGPLNPRARVNREAEYWVERVKKAVSDRKTSTFRTSEDHYVAIRRHLECRESCRHLSAS